MVANSTLNVVNLDFDSGKQDLITFLQSQPRFKDYDFTGSNINVLLDILQYNTFRNAFYLNMAISEGFIDSAQLTNSIRSHAKELNYVPRSAQSAKGTVTVNFTATGDSQPYIIAKGQTFSSIVKNNTFLFSIPETITAASTNTTFSFTTNIYEGNYIKDSYVFNPTTDNPHPSFAITNPNVDTRSITVTVFEDGSVVGDTYKYAISLLDLNNESYVYFLQCSAITGDYEVIFGDGIVGHQPKQGAIIVIDYRVTVGAQANGASTFVINFDPTGGGGELVSIDSVVTDSPSVSGYDHESLETTRFYAPRWFQTQERAVVAQDYPILLKTQFPEINAVTAYGGEDLVPPQYGTVVIAVDVAQLDTLPKSLENNYYSFIKNRCPLTVTPVLIAAQHTYIDVATIVRYNVNISADSIQRIATVVTGAVTDFNDLYLDEFNVIFRHSQLVESISHADPSIVSNITNVKLYKKIIPVPTIPTNFTLDFAVPLIDDLPPTPTIHSIIERKVVTSDLFTYDGVICSLEDDGDGLVRVVTQISGKYNTVDTVGTIDYQKGIVSLNRLNVDSYLGSAINVYVVPKDVDVASSSNIILSIESNNIHVTVEQIAV